MRRSRWNAPSWLFLCVVLPSCTPGPSSGAQATTSGSSTTEASTSATALDSSSSTSGGAILDIPPGGPGECLECSVIIDSKQSGALEVLGDEVFAAAELEGYTVYTMGTFGNGRFVATADTSLPLAEQTDCPILPWLAGSYEPEPSILLFGWADDELELGEWMFSSDIHLPAEYLGDPERLAEDYDVVIYFEESEFIDMGEEPSTAELQTVLEYTALGGGLIVSSEYANPGGGFLTLNDLDSVNRILQPLGLESQQVNLSWGEVEGEIEFPCFPPVE